MKFLNNFKNPQGRLGDRIIDQMNEKNAAVAVWGIGHLEITEDMTVLDIGCGGGTNVRRMAENARKAYGVDYSQKAVERSKKYCKIQSNAEIIRADVSSLPFEDDTFDVITAIKTVFFWPDLENDFREVKRVLKPGGSFAIIVDYNGSKGKRTMKFAERLLEMEPENDSYYAGLLLEVGFSEVTSYIRNTSAKKETKKVNNSIKEVNDDRFGDRASFSDKMDEWICVIAKK